MESLPDANYLREAIDRPATVICPQLTPEQVSALVDRANMVLNNMRFCGGRDIHEIGCIRNTAILLLDYLGANHATCNDFAEAILKRLEKKCVEYFKKKYSR